MRRLTIRSSSLVVVLALSRCAGTAYALPVAPCPYCGTDKAPATTGPTSRIAPASEPGTPLEITGTVYHADGRRAAAGVVIYAHQPDARGYVPPMIPEREKDHLQGWVRTDSAGRYRFLTIRPGGANARVDLFVAAPGAPERRLDPITLDGAGSARVVTDAQGVQHVVRDIILERLP
jgi:hypothetical protein